MSVVERIELIIILKKCSFIQHYEKFGTFSVTNGYENTGIPRFILNFLQNCLNSYFWVQIAERDVLLDMCNGILFYET